MHDAPSIEELITSVKAFIDDTAIPALEGRAAFHGKVASNVLAIVLRDLSLRKTAEVAESARLQLLLDVESNEAGALNEALAHRLRRGELTLDTPGLLDHLRETAEAQLAIDQPQYKRTSDPGETPQSS